MQHAIFTPARIALLALVAGWSLGGITVASAQQADEPESAAAEEENTQGPPWDTSCSQASREAEPNCEMSQIVIVPESRQVLLRVEISVPGDRSRTRMVLQLPHGLYLPAGIRLAIDGEEWQETQIQTCDGNGCYAGVEIDEDAVARLQAGAQLTVVFQSLAREDVTVPVDLNGFTDAYARIR